MGSETTVVTTYDHLPVWASGNLYFNGACDGKKKQMQSQMQNTL